MTMRQNQICLILGLLFIGTVNTNNLFEEFIDVTSVNENPNIIKNKNHITERNLKIPEISTNLVEIQGQLTEAYLVSNEIFIVKPFCKNSYRVSSINYFHTKKSINYGWVLNEPLDIDTDVQI